MYIRRPDLLREQPVRALPDAARQGGRAQGGAASMALYLCSDNHRRIYVRIICHLSDNMSSIGDMICHLSDDMASIGGPMFG